jgi:hypothetical protein
MRGSDQDRRAPFGETRSRMNCLMPSIRKPVPADGVGDERGARPQKCSRFLAMRSAPVTTPVRRQDLPGGPLAG